MRSRKVRQCCSASTVVGTSMATCLPPVTALKAARMATSVLPKPTSPQIRRSIGRGASMSRLTSSMARSWSGVSVKWKEFSNSHIQRVSGGWAMPGPGLALGLDAEQLGGVVEDGFFGGCARAFFQRPSPSLRQRRRASAEADVAADEVGLVDRDVRVGPSRYSMTSSSPSSPSSVPA